MVYRLMEQVLRCATTLHTICRSCFDYHSRCTGSSCIDCSYTYNVVSKLLQVLQSVLSGSSIIHSGYILRLSVVTASSLVGIDYVISVNSIPSWLLPGEGDGCGRLGGRGQVGWRGWSLTYCRNPIKALLVCQFMCEQDETHQV